jgi:hypothetical protein
MTSGEGAYVEDTSAYGGVANSSVAFDISSLSISSGDIPRNVQLWAKRVSGGDDAGYSVGDWIKLESTYRHGDNGIGYMIWSDNVTVNIKSFSIANWLFAPDRTSGAAVNLSTSGWTIYMRAWK